MSDSKLSLVLFKSLKYIYVFLLYLPLFVYLLRVKAVSKLIESEQNKKWKQPATYKKDIRNTLSEDLIRIMAFAFSFGLNIIKILLTYD